VSKVKSDKGDAVGEAQVIHALLSARDWKFAKSMPTMPHWYTLRWQWPADVDFLRVVRFIKTHGFDETFQGRKYRVLVLGGFKYWAMCGLHVPPKPFKREDLVIINRKPATAEDYAAARAARTMFDQEQGTDGRSK